MSLLVLALEILLISLPYWISYILKKRDAVSTGTDAAHENEQQTEGVEFFKKRPQLLFR